MRVNLKVLSSCAPAFVLPCMISFSCYIGLLLLLSLKYCYVIEISFRTMILSIEFVHCDTEASYKLNRFCYRLCCAFFSQFISHVFVLCCPLCHCCSAVRAVFVFLVSLVILSPREPGLSLNSLTGCAVPFFNVIINKVIINKVIIDEHVLKCSFSYVSPEPEEG